MVASASSGHLASLRPTLQLSLCSLGEPGEEGKGALGQGGRDANLMLRLQWSRCRELN